MEHANIAKKMEQCVTPKFGGYVTQNQDFGNNSPVLSAQLITAPTGKPRDIRNLAPAEPPRP